MKIAWFFFAHGVHWIVWRFHAHTPETATGPNWQPVESEPGGAK